MVRTSFSPAKRDTPAVYILPAPTSEVGNRPAAHAALHIPLRAHIRAHAMPPAQEDGLAVRARTLRRARAELAETRRGPRTDRRPVVAALRELACDFEALSGEQTAVIEVMRDEARESVRRYESLKKAMRLSVEKGVESARRLAEAGVYNQALKAEVEVAKVQFSSLRIELREAVEKAVADCRRLEREKGLEAERLREAETEVKRLKAKVAAAEERAVAGERSAEAGKETCRDLAKGMLMARRGQDETRARLRKAVEKAVEAARGLAAEKGVSTGLAHQVMRLEKNSREQIKQQAEAEQKMQTEHERSVNELKETVKAVEEHEAGKVIRYESLVSELRESILFLENGKNEALERYADMVADLESAILSLEGEAEAATQRSTTLTKQAKRDKMTILNLEACVADHDQARLESWKNNQEQLEMISKLETNLEERANDLRNLRQSSKEQESTIASKEFEALRLADSLRNSEQLVSSQRTLTATHAAETKQAQTEVQELRRVSESQRIRIEAMEEKLAATAKLAEEQRTARAALERQLSDSKAECESLGCKVAELQTVCTGYASAIAKASRQDSPCHSEAQERVPFAEAGSLSGENGSERNNAGQGESKNLAKKYVLSPDVPDFIPTALASAAATDKAPEAPLEISDSYPKLYWAPPGTKCSVLRKTIHKEDAESVQILEVNGERWADGAALWYDVATALIPDAGCAYDSPAEGSSEFWDAIEAAFLSAAGDEDDDVVASAPLVLVIRKAGMLASAFEESDEAVVGYAFEAIQKITNVVDQLQNIYSTLVANRFSVSVVLEGWPGAVPLGSHIAHSLALPRVSRRSGKARRYNRNRTQLALR